MSLLYLVVAIRPRYAIRMSVASPRWSRNLWGTLVSWNVGGGSELIIKPKSVSFGVEVIGNLFLRELNKALGYWKKSIE